MKHIIDLYKRAGLKEWPYPQMKFLSDEQIDAFTDNVGYAGVRERKEKNDVIQARNNAYGFGRAIAVILFSQLLGYLLFVAGSIYIIYWVVTLGGGK